MDGGRGAFELVVVEEFGWRSAEVARHHGR
jgi:hypothetical protein